jgi:hypothetical protein
MIIPYQDKVEVMAPLSVNPNIPVSAARPIQLTDLKTFTNASKILVHSVYFSNENLPEKPRTHERTNTGSFFQALTSQCPNVKTIYIT